MISDQGNNVEHTPNIQDLNKIIYMDLHVYKNGNASTEIRRWIVLGSNARALKTVDRTKMRCGIGDDFLGSLDDA